MGIRYGSVDGVQMQTLRLREMAASRAAVTGREKRSSGSQGYGSSRYIAVWQQVLLLPHPNRAQLWPQATRLSSGFGTAVDLFLGHAHKCGR